VKLGGQRRSLTGSPVELFPCTDGGAVGDQRLAAGAVRGHVPAVGAGQQAEAAVRFDDQLKLLPCDDGGAVGDQRLAAGVLCGHVPAVGVGTQGDVPAAEVDLVELC